MSLCYTCLTGVEEWCQGVEYSEWRWHVFTQGMYPLVGEYVPQGEDS